MAIDPTKLQNLRDRVTSGETIHCAEVVKVYWNDSTIRYYAIKDYDQMPNFSGINLGPIEVKLISNDGFQNIPLNGDLNDAEFTIELLDFDRSIKTLFQENGTVKMEIYYYYPQEDLLTPPVWWGRLQPPDDLSTRVLVCKASNGLKSNKIKIPRRMRPAQCTAIFGGMLETQEQINRNGCPYNKHIGGSIGTEISPGVFYTSCPRRDKVDCNLRMGTSDGKYYLGYDFDENLVLVDPDSGYIGQSKGNRSNLKEPIRVIYGFKIVRELFLLLFLREPNVSHPDTGWIAALWEVCEGPVDFMQHPFVNDQLINPQHYSLRLGNWGQSVTPFPGLDDNYSSTVLAFTRYGQTNPFNHSPSSLTSQITVRGKNDVRVYSDSVTYASQYTNNRSWCLMDVYTNLKWGLGYDYSVFDIQSFIDAADWLEEEITFTDDNGTVYELFRNRFEIIMQGLTAQEQITNICRSGRMSVPYQHEGKYTVSVLSKATPGELSSARVFSDEIGIGNILRKTEKGESDLSFAQVSDDALVNHIVLTFEDRIIYHKERPLTISDDNQKAKAGKALGKIGFEDIQKEYNAYGIVRESEALYLGWALLWFGEFDSGGIKNNLSGNFITKYFEVADLKKYDIVRIESDKLEGYTDNEGNLFSDNPYFRIMHIQKLPNQEARVKVQVYNKLAYDNFEIPSVPGAPTPEEGPVPVDVYPTCRLQLGIVTYSSDDAMLTVPIEPC